jgi:hypothetical protein
MGAEKRYAAILREFMSYKDGTAYAGSRSFTEEELLLTKPSDICRWMKFKAYGDPAPTEDMRPVHARSSTLKFNKKALSFFMPRQSIPWDPILQRGNPSRAGEVNKLIKAVLLSEVRREGVASQARRPIEFDEFLNVLALVRAGSDRTGSKFKIGSVLSLQWHLIARIDDMMKLRFSDFSPNIHQRFTLTCQMRWSKNILEERDAPEQIVMGSMDPKMCPILNLAVYIEATPRITASEFLYGSPHAGDRMVRRFLQQAFGNTRFSKLKGGKMGTHS